MVSKMEKATKLEGFHRWVVEGSKLCHISLVDRESEG